MSTTKLETIEEHIIAAGDKLRDLVDVHLPAIEQFMETLSKNPLVTAFSASIPGEIGDDTMAVLNGLLPILGALGAKIPTPPAVPVPIPPSRPLDGDSSSTPADTPTPTGSDNAQ